MPAFSQYLKNEDVNSIADWMVLKKSEKPQAEMFLVANLKKELEAETRPVTFVSNGGPRSSSAYLHMGLCPLMPP